jgi:dihydroxyacid dehydratase/phosphogluconate dehydratase
LVDHSTCHSESDVQFSRMKATRKTTRRGSPYALSPRPFSARVLDGPERAPSRAMLYPVGFKPEDFSKPIVGIASTWSRVTPCNMHIDQLAREAEAGANAAGGKAIIFNTITVSDGISMGSEGMKYSLVSREVIADSIETVVGCQGMDGFVAIGGCDKNMPGALIAMARLNRPAVFVYGGTILPGCITGIIGTSTSSLYSRPLARARTGASKTGNSRPSNPARFRDRVPAGACTRRTRWPAPSKPSA